jgi:hypothetical protein
MQEFGRRSESRGCSKDHARFAILVPTTKRRHVQRSACGKSFPPVSQRASLKWNPSFAVVDPRPRAPSRAREADAGEEAVVLICESEPFPGFADRYVAREISRLTINSPDKLDGSRYLIAEVRD